MTHVYFISDNNEYYYTYVYLNLSSCSKMYHRTKQT